MSFLNPVNEPVLRFKSTDAGAPQINYNARTAGDVKAVLKACLVTGYGTKASAGWTAVNEVGHVAEFVSPSASLGGYQLGVNDASTSSSAWYYTYEGVTINPAHNTVSKNITEINKSSTDNGWELIITSRGLYFVEIVYGSLAKSKVARLTYWGQIKSAIYDSGQNISFWNVGMGGLNDVASRFFQNTLNNSKHYNKLGAYDSGFSFIGTNLSMLERQVDQVASTTEIVNPIYIQNTNALFGEYAGILLKNTNDASGLFGVYDTTFNDRPVLYLCISLSTSIVTSPPRFSVAAMIYLDFWEY